MDDFGYNRISLNGQNINEERINLDELFEKTKQRNEKKLKLFTLCLKRVMQLIRRSANNGSKFTWYAVPAIVLAAPSYDHGELIAFLLDRLRQNKLVVQYCAPNYLFISWNHIYPTYVRNEFNKQTGLVMDMFGNITDPEVERQEEEARKRQEEEAAVAAAEAMRARRSGGGGGGGGRGASSLTTGGMGGGRAAAVYTDDMLMRTQKRSEASFKDY